MGFNEKGIMAHSYWTITVHVNPRKQGPIAESAIDGRVGFCVDHDLEARGNVDIVVIGDIDGCDHTGIIGS